ncbi:MAG: tRNA (guanosine(37)-N1)-methyltransferase TrmD [Chloroflexota bacterium]
MRIDVFTLFPNLFPPYLEESIVKRAISSKLIEINLHNIRDWAVDKHSVTDDTPFGGGGGMIMKPEPLFAAVESTLGTPTSCPVILLTPQGRPFNQSLAVEFAKQPQLALISGRYESVDERVRRHLATDEISIGDFVLTGGELPALMLIDAITRLQPGALGDPQGAKNESFMEGLLEHPHYTRPRIFREWPVPEVLLSGDHQKIAKWRREESLRRTFERRPELLASLDLTEEDRKFLNTLEG